MGENLKFIIVEAAHWDTIDFEVVNEPCLHATRRSHDGKYIILSYCDDQPNFCFHITGDEVGVQEYTYAEILHMVQTDEQWAPTD